MPPAKTQQSKQGHSNGDVWPDPEVKGRGRLPEHDPTNSVYAMNVLHEGRPLSINDIDRPVFVNHYYAVGEPQLTSKRLIRIDEYDEPSMDSSRNYQTQIPRGTQLWGTTHECIEPSRDLIEMPTSPKNVRDTPSQKEHQRGFHSEPIEHWRHSPGTVSVGKSRVQAADANHVDPQQVPLTGYKNYHQEFQTYPASRELVMVQPTATTSNTSNLALMDLPNVNTNLPPPSCHNKWFLQCHSLHRNNRNLQL